MSQPQDWQNLTLGEVYRRGIAKFRQARRAFIAYSPLKLDLSATRNLWQLIRPHLLAPILYILQGMGQAPSLLPSGDRPSESLQPAKENQSVAQAQNLAMTRSLNKPWYRRRELVNRVLHDAWSSGYHTYEQLITQVRHWTGKGCSKRAISRFLKQRRCLEP